MRKRRGKKGVRLSKCLAHVQGGKDNVCSSQGVPSPFFPSLDPQSGVRAKVKREEGEGREEVVFRHRTQRNHVCKAASEWGFSHSPPSFFGSAHHCPPPPPPPSCNRCTTPLPPPPSSPLRPRSVVGTGVRRPPTTSSGTASASRNCHSSSPFCPLLPSRFHLRRSPASPSPFLGLLGGARKAGRKRKRDGMSGHTYDFLSSSSCPCDGSGGGRRGQRGQHLGTRLMRSLRICPRLYYTAFTFPRYPFLSKREWRNFTFLFFLPTPPFLFLHPLVVKGAADSTPQKAPFFIPGGTASR